MKLRLLLILGALGAASCATTPTITTDADPAADFTRYHSYSWVYSSAPRGMNPVLYQRVRDSIDRSLAARSFTQAEPGDFAIGFTLGRRDSVEVDQMGAYGGFYPGYGAGYRFGWARAYSPVEVRNISEGTLAIDVYDAQTHRPVWQGLATQQINPGQVDQAQIDAAIDAVLARFPAQPAAAPSAPEPEQ